MAWIGCSRITALWWMPSTGEYGPQESYGDFEHHEEVEYFPPVIRGKSFYVVVTDSLDVPSVIRAPVPFR